MSVNLRKPVSAAWLNVSGPAVSVPAGDVVLNPHPNPVVPLVDAGSLFARLERECSEPVSLVKGVRFEKRVTPGHRIGRERVILNPHPNPVVPLVDAGSLFARLERELNL